MKKTITINISGLVFNIEEDAYASLKNYLESIGNKFNNLAERQEIIEDIEARIAELFSEKLSRSKEVINEQDVEAIKIVMGSPDNFEEDESSEYSQEKTEPKTQKKKKNKKFYRDTDNNVLGGVCAGASNYFDWDVAIVRVIFLLSVIFLGTGVLIYIIFWIATPEAKSTSEKLAMKGKNATVDNISNFVTKVRTSVENIDTEQLEENIKKHSNKFNDFLIGTSKKFNETFRPKETGLKFMYSVYSFIGFILMSIGIVLLISIIYSIIQTSNSGIGELFEEIFSRSEMNFMHMDIIKATIYILITSIAIAITLKGMRLAFNRNKELIEKTKPLRTSARFTIIFSIIGLIALAIFNKASFSNFSYSNSQNLDYKTIVVRKLNILPENEHTVKAKLDIRKTGHNIAWIRVSIKGRGFRSLSNSSTRSDPATRTIAR